MRDIARARFITARCARRYDAFDGGGRRGGSARYGARRACARGENMRVYAARTIRESVRCYTEGSRGAI